MRYLVFFLLLFLPCVLSAKEYPMLHYTLEDGLPSNTIYDTYQDAQGFIWIGTDKGIARYNGVKFENFTTADGLADNECFFFVPDAYGRLWIGTFNGELCYYKNGKFYNASNTPWMKLSHKAAGTIEIVRNNDSSLIFVFKDDPGFWELKNQKFTYFNAQFLVDNYQIIHWKHVCKNRENDFEIFFQTEKIIADRKLNIKKNIPYKGFYIFNVYCQNEKKYLFDQENRMYDSSLTLIKWNKELAGKVVNKVFKNETHEIISTNGGLYFDDFAPILPHLVVQSFTLDQHQYLWVGTAKNGLFRISKQFPQSEEFRNVLDDEQVVFAMRQSNFLFWGSKRRNITRFNLLSGDKKEIFRNIDYSHNNMEQTSSMFILGSSLYNFSHLENFRISNIFGKQQAVKKMKIGELWGAYKTFKIDNTFFLKGRQGVFYFDYDKLVNGDDTIKRGVILIEAKFNNLYGMGLDNNQNLWLSDIKYVYKLENKIPFAQYQFKNITYRELIFCNEYIVGYTHHNNLLVCSDYNSSKIKIDTIKNQDCVWDKFYKVNDSVILISTNNYFRILSFHSHAKEKYTLRVLETPFIPYQPEFTYIDSSKCYFFKNGSISSFPIAYVLEQKPPPTVEFLSLKTSRKSYIIKKSVSLDYFEARDINILFTAVSFFNKNLSYEYSLSTGDNTDSWIKIDGGELNLFKLGFGNFTVKIRAKTLSGDYSAPVSFNLNIARPYWATWWFLSICGLGVVLLIAYAARIGIRRSLKKKEGEVRFLRSEYKALNALMNPHFIFNSLNSVQSLVNNNENTRASKYIRIFSDLIRQNMSNISNDLISLSKEMSLVENYLRIEQLRFKDKLEYEINIDEDVESEMIMIPPLLIQPLVENSIKHGIWPKKVHDGHISISIYEKGDLLFVEIEDNGVGINSVKSSDTLHESYAMSNIHKRIEQLSVLHQTKIEVKLDNRTDAGGNIIGAKAVITIYIPSGV